MARPAASITVVMALVLASLCLSGCRSRHVPQSPPIQIAIAYPTNISPALALIALDKGFLEAPGVQIDAKALESGKAALEQLLAGQADVAFAAETPIARAILNGGDLKILATIEESGLDVRIIARKDKGILSPKDLRGKKIGYTQGTSGHYFLDSFLLANGLGLREVRLLNLAPLELRDALLKGSIDAVVTWDPHVGILIGALGDRGVVFRDEFIYTQLFCVVARPEFTRDHPEQVKMILKGLISAKNLLSRSPDEAVASIAKLAKVDPGLVAQAIPNHDFDVRLDQALITSLEDESQWLIDSGSVPAQKIPDFSSRLDLRGLLEVRPRGVQVIHPDPGGKQ